MNSPDFESMFFIVVKSRFSHPKQLFGGAVFGRIYRRIDRRLSCELVRKVVHIQRATHFRLYGWRDLAGSHGRPVDALF